MYYGTIKTELWTHQENVGCEYYRYEVIPRWWGNSDNAEQINWKHTIVRIEKDGSVTPLEIWNRPPAYWWLELENYLDSEPMSYTGPLYDKGRKVAAEQHQWIVRHCMA